MFMRRTVSPFLFLLVWAVGLAAPVAAQDAAAEGRPVCFISGRTAQCTFTFVFDAAIERFTEVHARPQGTDSITDRASMPIDRFTLPVLTGEAGPVLTSNLEALSATLAASARTLQSECVDAAAATAEQLCLPRLYEASATAQRQAGLARSLRALAA